MTIRITIRQTFHRNTDNETSVERLVNIKNDQPDSEAEFVAAITNAIIAANEADGPVTAVHAFIFG